MLQSEMCHTATHTATHIATHPTYGFERHFAGKIGRKCDTLQHMLRHILHNGHSVRRHFAGMRRSELLADVLSDLLCAMVPADAALYLLQKHSGAPVSKVCVYVCVCVCCHISSPLKTLWHAC